MTKKTYWDIPTNPEVKREVMIKQIEAYLNAKLQGCYVETEAEEDVYTTVCKTYNKGKKRKELIVMKLQMLFCGTTCMVEFEYNTNRIVFNIILAVLTIPTVLLPCVFFITAIYRIYQLSKMRKELIKIMEEYTI